METDFFEEETYQASKKTVGWRSGGCRVYLWISVWYVGNFLQLYLILLLPNIFILRCVFYLCQRQWLQWPYGEIILLMGLWSMLHSLWGICPWRWRWWRLLSTVRWMPGESNSKETSSLTYISVSSKKICCHICVVHIVLIIKSYFLCLWWFKLTNHLLDLNIVYIL